MKKQVLLTVLTIWSLTLFSQEKAALTKQETVNYLNKKIKEISGNYMNGKQNSLNEYYNSDQSVESSNDNFYITYNYCNYKNRNGTTIKYYMNYESQFFDCDFFILDLEYKFNPAHIKDIKMSENSLEGSPVGYIIIQLIGKTVTRTDKRTTPQRKADRPASLGYCWGFGTTNANTTVDYIKFPFLQSDPTNFNKIKKALEYLRDLCKAEDDPFGN